MTITEPCHTKIFSLCKSFNINDTVLIKDIDKKESLLWGLRALPLLFSFSLHAQRADENAVMSADDAFGTMVGIESLGLYDEGGVRGFSPGVAGNYRINGIYFDKQANLNVRIKSGSDIRVGSAAQGYTFPAPTGIVDINLRDSGNDLTLSPRLSYGPFGSYGLEFDAQVPILKDELSTALGISSFNNQFGNGGHSKSQSMGVVQHWHPNPKIEIITFWGGKFTYGETAQGTYVTAGDFLPPHITRGRYPGPTWSTSDSSGTNYGTLARVAFGDWTLRTGVFRSVDDRGTSFQNLINLVADGSVSRFIVAYPDSRSASTSGEARASRVVSDGPRQHRITFSVRARHIDSKYGGGDEADFVSTGINNILTVPQPNFNFGSLTDDQVRQISGAVSYGLNWKGVGELILGMQQTRYTKLVTSPGESTNRQVNNALLPTLSVAVPLTNSLSLYGSHVKGLENAGTAPGFAVNGNQVLPAIHTEQWDVGVEWSIAKDTTLIIGYYNISKPYLALNQANVYGTLGTDTHKGFEIVTIQPPLSANQSLRIIGLYLDLPLTWLSEEQFLSEISAFTTSDSCLMAA